MPSPVALWAASGWARALGVGLLALAVAVGAFARFDLLSSHFAHIDDVGVAVTVQQAQSHPPDLEALADEARRKTRDGRGTARTALLLKLQALPPVRVAARLGRPLFAFVAVPLGWSYAPLPFLATPLLIHPGQSYAQVKALGRLPSVGFALLALLLIGLTAARIASTNRWLVAAVAVAPPALSREFVVMSDQMHSYAASAAVSAAILWLTAHDAGRVLRPLDWRYGVSRALLIGLFCYTSYQASVLLPGYFLAMGGALLRTEPPRRWIARAWPLAVLAAAFALIFAPAYLFRVRGMAVIWWNAGPHQEFLRPAAPSIPDVLGFLLRDGWLSAEAMLSPAPTGTVMGMICVGALLLLAGVGLLAGLAQLGRPCWTPAIAVAVYAAGVLGLLLALVLARALTLSPTRHLLVYLPVLAVLAASGADRACATLGARGAAALGVAATVVVATLVPTFAIGFPALSRERRDPMDEAAVAALARREGADVVVAYGYTPQPLLMPQLRAVAPVFDLDTPGSAPPVAGAAPRRILFMSMRGPLTRATCEAATAALGAAHPGAYPAGCRSAAARVLVDRPSSVEVEASSATRNGSNGLFMTLAAFPSSP